MKQKLTQFSADLGQDPSNMSTAKEVSSTNRHHSNEHAKTVTRDCDFADSSRYPPKKKSNKKNSITESSANCIASFEKIKRFWPRQSQKSSAEIPYGLKTRLFQLSGCERKAAENKNRRFHRDRMCA